MKLKNGVDRVARCVLLTALTCCVCVWMGFRWAEIGQYTGTSPVEDCAAYGKYVPASNVDVHAKIVLDACLLEEKVGALRTPGGSDKDFLGASEVYNNGFNAVNADGSKRTLIDMAKKASTSPMWQKVSCGLRDRNRGEDRAVGSIDRADRRIGVRTGQGVGGTRTVGSCGSTADWGADREGVGGTHTVGSCGSTADVTAAMTATKVWFVSVAL
eukprot:2885386-Pyramimonas_sp.AAC.3